MTQITFPSIAKYDMALYFTRGRPTPEFIFNTNYHDCNATLCLQRIIHIMATRSNIHGQLHGNYMFKKTTRTEKHVAERQRV